MNFDPNFKKHIFTDMEISEKVKSGEYFYNTLLVINEDSGSKRTVLNFAARHGYLNTLAALRDTGLTAEQIDETFPLFTAAKNNQIAAMEAILDMDEGHCNMDMEVQVRDNGRNRYFANMLFYFFEYIPKVYGRLQDGHVRAFWVLVYYGIDLAAQNKMGYTIADLVYLNRVHKETKMILEYAVQYFNVPLPDMSNLDEVKEFFANIRATQLHSIKDSYGFDHCFI